MIPVQGDRIQMRESLTIGLDVGTTKICVMAGMKTQKGVKIMAVGSSASRGLKKGIVVDMEETTASIRKALEEAEDRGKIKIESAYVGIAGGHIKSFNGYGVMDIREREIKGEDISRLIDMATATYVPVDREILQIMPLGFSIDGTNGIINPLGRKGRRLEVKVHIVTGAITPVQNLIRCCEAAGVRVADIVLEPIASAEAVLSDKEKEDGTILIDLGGGTTDLAVFREGILRHTSSLAIGGNHITNDIATGLGITIGEAEELKKAYGLKEKKEIILDGRGKFSPEILSEIIYLRCEELFSLIRKEIITFSGYRNRDKLPSYIKGVVLTGGTSLLQGIEDIAEKILSLPVRIGIPADITDNNLKNPIYSTGIGLVRFGQGYSKVSHGSEGVKSENKGRHRLPLRNSLKDSAHRLQPLTFFKVFDRMKDWVTGFLNK